MGKTVLDETFHMNISTIKKTSFLKGFGDCIAPILEESVRDMMQLIAHHVPRGQVASPMLQRMGWKEGAKMLCRGQKNESEMNEGRVISTSDSE